MTTKQTYSSFFCRRQNKTFEESSRDSQITGCREWSVGPSHHYCAQWKLRQLPSQGTLAASQPARQDPLPVLHHGRNQLLHLLIPLQHRDVRLGLSVWQHTGRVSQQIRSSGRWSNDASGLHCEKQPADQWSPSPGIQSTGDRHYVH